MWVEAYVMLIRWLLVVSWAAKVARLMMESSFRRLSGTISHSWTVIIDALLLAYKGGVDVMNLSLSKWF